MFGAALTLAFCDPPSRVGGIASPVYSTLLPPPMFVRFHKHHPTRLYVSLVENRRLDGTIRQMHVASLGALAAEQPSVRERSETWRTLHEVIARKGLAGNVAAKLMTALQLCVPLPTMEEIGAAELAEAEHDSAFWQSILGQTAKLIECHKELKVREADEKAARLGNYKSARRGVSH
jgi:hypothetical protein